MTTKTTVTPTNQTRTTTSSEGYTVVDGTESGAMYMALRPDEWNGSLVLLLHGLVPADAPVTLPPPGHEPLWSDLVDRLVSAGYGVAYSSYRTNGFAVREGTIDSQVAEQKFTAAFGKPDVTYLVGASMGALIGQRLVETTPGSYAGHLSVCGAFGGATIQWAYMVNARILFDVSFPGVLPGTVWSQTGPDVISIESAVVAAMTERPESFARAVELAGIDQLKIPWTTPDELVGGIVAVLVATGGQMGDFQAKAGGIAVDNTQTIYTGSSDDTALNARVQRFVADPNARRFLTGFDPDGTLGTTPVLALHNTRDPLVQYQLHDAAYQAVLAATGNEHLFHAQFVNRFGHGAVTVDEIVAAFEHLVDWVTTDTAP